MGIKFLAKIKSDNRGYALIIVAVGLSVLLLYFTVIVATQTIDTQANIKAFKASSDAKGIAESVMGGLIGLGQEHEAGFSLGEEECTTLLQTVQYVVDATANGVKIKCNIKGRLKEKEKIEGWYTIPSVNTGNASINCQPLRPILTETDLQNMGLSGVIQSPLDYSCNWGRLNFGNSISSRVVIPMYYEENNEIKNPSNFSLDDFQIRVRTACKPARQRGGCINPDTNKVDRNLARCKYDDICGNDDRYVFGVSPFDPIDENKTVVMWQISATCVAGDGSSQSCGLTPDTTTLREVRSIENSEIDQYFIDANEHVGLDTLGKSFGFGEQSVTISDFLTSPNVQKPTLQLAIIARNLKDEVDTSVPNLEYQILTDAAIANSTQIYEVTVNYNGQIWKDVKLIEPKKNVVDFAIQN